MNIKTLIATAGLIWGLSGSSFSQPTQAPLPQNFRTIEEALACPQSGLFYLQRVDGRYNMGDTMSQFNNNKNFKDLTFDVSNNKVLANMSAQGTLKNISTYRNSYFASCGPEANGSGGWPGVWVAKDNSSFGPYSFTLQVDGKRYDLDTVNWDFRTGLLDNLFPLTELKAPEGYKVSLIAYAPMSPDGSQRIRGLVYGLLLQNTSSRRISGSVFLPRLFAGARQAYKDGVTSWALWDPYDYEVTLGDAGGRVNVGKENAAESNTRRVDSVSFSLEKGGSLWVPAVFSMLGDSALQQVNAKTTLGCLKETWLYYRNLLGKVQTPGDPWLSAFYERQVMESFGSLGMSADGKIAGSNWGSYPTTRQIWMKDCFYAALPFMQIDPLLAKKLISWFREFGMRPAGMSQQGGVNHSVGLSVSSIILATLYYQASGDKAFFLQNQSFKTYWENILQQLIRSRQDPGVWLFPSRYISDGPIAQDYHTGSNVCAWKAFQGYARLLKEVYNDAAGAAKYTAIAVKIREAILQKCTIDGPYGRQFIEGSYRDGRKPQMVSDGEESDITLMPFYGFVSYDDPVYLNYMKFSVSENNLIYEPLLHAITWFGVESTAPGYMKGICAGTGKEALFGEHGYYSEVRKVTDADGSIWWWCYGWAKEMVSDFERAKNVTPYGQLVRGVPGKAGWFSGVHTAVFRTRLAGLTYDAPKKLLRWTPFSPSSDLSWKDISFGGHVFSVSYTRAGAHAGVEILNRNTSPVNLETTIPLEDSTAGYIVTINGKPATAVKQVRYFDFAAIQVSIVLNPGIKTEILVSKENRVK